MLPSADAASEAAIWALIDDRAGHSTQTLGLADRLGVAYHTKRIEYNVLAALPNALNATGTWHLNAASKNSVRPPYPKMVIGCGRRIAPVLRAIKRASPNTVTVYLMWPDSLKGIDLAIVPAHDNPPNDPRVLVTTAPLTAITPEGLKAAERTMRSRFSHLPRPWVVVCVGASIKGMEFTSENWREMIARARRLAGDGSLLITTSRRTALATEELLENELTGSCYLHRYTAGAYNPYMGFLACADALCISGDSLSMAVEATVTGKPVFIYTPDHATAHKHAAQHQSLFDKNLARPLREKSSIHWKPDTHVSDIHYVIRALHHRFSHVFTGKKQA
jgi:mitochondrial fission protein ELM1